MGFKFWQIAKVTGSPATKREASPLVPYNDLTAAIAEKVAKKDIKKAKKENKH